MRRAALLLGLAAACAGDPQAGSPARDVPTRRVAAVVTEYRHSSHADVIVSRLLLTDMLDGTGRDSPLKLASLYADQRRPSDISRPATGRPRRPAPRSKLRRPWPPRSDRSSSAGSHRSLSTAGPSPSPTSTPATS